MQEQWLRLIHVKGLSLNQKVQLIRHLGNADAVLGKSRDQLAACLAESLCSNCTVGESFAPESRAISLAARQGLQRLDQIGADFLPLDDPNFPPQLSNIDLPPLGLFYRGDPLLLGQLQLAVVGSRNASRGGCLTAGRFAQALSERGLVITSGLAIGIDTSAHRGALDAGQPTVAVVATGIDRIYPMANRVLHRRIVEAGVVVTEYPPGTAPRKAYFPQRNRIISGLSIGTLVVEAGLRSGSLITARLAAEQGREVFAIPGSVHYAGSRGCHALLRQGAGLIESPADIIDELSLLPSTRNSHQPCPITPSPGLEDQQRQIYDLIDFTACPIDQIISLSGLTADQVSSILVRLELLGLVAESAGGYQRLP